MDINILLANIEYSSLDNGPLDIRHLTCKSNKAKNGSLFVAIKGTSYDGFDFIDDAINNGSIAIVSEKSAPRHLSIPFYKVVKSINLQ